MPVLPTSGVPFDSAQLTRRGFIAAGIAGGLTLAGCGQSKPPAPGAAAQMAAAIAAAEAARPHSGRTVTASLTPQPTQIDLGGPIVRTLAFGNTIPGPLIRAKIGDELVVNGLQPARRADVGCIGTASRCATTWTAPSPPPRTSTAGQDFTYRFSVPNSGTYWAHPHTGLEDDMGLYLPVIVDDPTEGNYDAEWIVVLDDWTDGVGKVPAAALRRTDQSEQASDVEHAGSGTDDLRPPRPRRRARQPRRADRQRTRRARPPRRARTPPSPAAPAARVGNSDLLGGDAGDIAYPYYLINGRIPAAPTTFDAKPGQRIRIRFINTGSDTAFRVALAGHSMTVTHTDGFPVVPTQVDALLIGMAERYDVIVTAADGVFPLVALAEGKNALARALLSTGNGQPTRPAVPTGRTHQTRGHHRDVHRHNAGQLGPARARPQPSGRVGRQHGAIQLDDQRRALRARPIRCTIRQGQRPTMTFDNTTMMYHPIHLHGHTFQLIKADGTPGARKDTVIVLPKQKLIAVLVADNPGRWVMHCHNNYHQVAGMQTVLDYVF